MSVQLFVQKHLSGKSLCVSQGFSSAFSRRTRTNCTNFGPIRRQGFYRSGTHSWLSSVQSGAALTDRDRARQQTCTRTSSRPLLSRVWKSPGRCCFFFSKHLKREHVERVLRFSLTSYHQGRRRSNGACKSDVYGNARRDVTAVPNLHAQDACLRVRVQ
jgi:hypothetical protein